jgi:predicted amidophosphoribosyltransferase
MCHPWTQELMRTPAPKSDPKGGIRRKLTKKQQQEVQQLPAQMDKAQIEELHNTCPKCGATAKATDSFCRQDGERLMLGKQCLACHAPQESSDQYCWQCGVKSGEKPAIEVLPPEENQAEDVLLRLRRLAKEKGLLKETVVNA